MPSLISASNVRNGAHGGFPVDVRDNGAPADVRGEADVRGCLTGL
jgi:hypothetical protein